MVGGGGGGGFVRLWAVAGTVLFMFQSEGGDVRPDTAGLWEDWQDAGCGRDRLPPPALPQAWSTCHSQQKQTDGCLSQVSCPHSHFCLQLQQLVLAQNCIAFVLVQKHRRVKRMLFIRTKTQPAFMCFNLVLERQQSFLFQTCVLVLKGDSECVFVCVLVCLLLWIRRRSGGVMLLWLS